MSKPDYLKYDGSKPEPPYLTDSDRIDELTNENIALSARVAVLTKALDDATADLVWILGAVDRFLNPQELASLKGFHSRRSTYEAALSAAGDPELLSAVQGLVKAAEHLVAPIDHSQMDTIGPCFEALREALAHPALRAWRTGG